MQEVAPGVVLIDTLLGGMSGVSAAYLVTGDQPALVDTGARTSAPVVRAALEEAGLGAGDLAWIVPTHVHLDHCGATGILAHAFPRAAVVTHRRGARHLIEPERLLAGSAAVYGPSWSLYGGLDRTPAERVVAVEDGHRVPVGPGRDLVLHETVGHARHHMAVVDEEGGTIIAGDAAGVRFPGGGLYPALPPPDIDVERGLASLERLSTLAPERLLLCHFGASPDAAADLALAGEQLRILGEAAGSAWRERPERSAVAAALARELPLEASVGAAGALARWRRLGWEEANVDGLIRWVVTQEVAAGR